MIEHDKLLKQFNKRDASAFEKVYLMFYRETYAYTAMLYRQTTTQAEDVLHDVFIDLWMSSIVFDSLQKVKAYVYTSVKNDFKNYIVHGKCVDKYYQAMTANDNFGIDVFESELYSEMDGIIRLLPEEYAQVVRLLVDGYKPAEIAKKLGRTQQTIYNLKYEAINWLRVRNIRNKLLFSILLSC